MKKDLQQPYKIKNYHSLRSFKRAKSAHPF